MGNQKPLLGLSKNKVRDIYNKTASYYNAYHRLGTYGLDEKGRNYLVDHIQQPGKLILDAGGGTGTTAIKIARTLDPEGKVIILDLSENMLDQARKKSNSLGLGDLIETKLGDMYEIPYTNNTFDTVVSTYSTCPLESPLKAVKEMFRVLKPGGILGIAHSTHASQPLARWCSTLIEKLIWLFPRLSLGCRNIDLREGIRDLDVDVLDSRIIGFIPFYFQIWILRKRTPGM